MCMFSGSMRVSSCRCCVLVSSVLPVAIRSAVFCMVCSFCVSVGDIIGAHMEQPYSMIGRVIVL